MVVSKIGTMSTRTGKAYKDTVKCMGLVAGCKQSIDRAKPIGRLPQSPMKMEAGWELYIKKAAEAPISNSETFTS
jgi:hypothetical protein